jgi:ABC-type amino acid transport substrate-binding protein
MDMKMTGFDLLDVVNSTIRRMKSDDSLKTLSQKYGLVYVY